MTKEEAAVLVLIQIEKEPQYICRNQIPHHEEFMKAFVGLQLSATHCPSNPGDMLVTPTEVIRAMVNADRIVGFTYWRWMTDAIWGGTDGLHRPFVFPEGCYKKVRQPRSEE